jgi:hypothetical protein
MQRRKTQALHQAVQSIALILTNRGDLTFDKTFLFSGLRALRQLGSCALDEVARAPGNFLPEHMQWEHLCPITSKPECTESRAQWGLPQLVDYFHSTKCFAGRCFREVRDYYSIQRKSNLPAEERSPRPSRDSATRIENCIGETLTTDSSGRGKGNAGLARGTRLISE